MSHPLKAFLRRALAVALAALVLAALGLAARAALSTPPAPQSSYALAQRAPFNRPDFYPIERRPDPALYRPHSEWMGRLILPAAAETAARSGDWVWLEVEQAPPQRAAWIGRRLRLSWQDTPSIRSLVGAVTSDIRFGPAAQQAAREGNVVPSRLDGRRRVGPLQSLAGARPNDDVTVELQEVRPVTPAGADPELRIGRSPVQITGRWTALVQLVEPAAGSDRYWVRHFDPASGRFEGPRESVRIPRQPPDRYGRRLFDPRGLETTPVGAAGWFLHGAPDAAGVFTVQALEPRLLTQLRADLRQEGTAAALHHISQVNWHDTPRQRGRISRVALWPNHGRRTILGRRDDPESRADWAIGDRALLIHSFGGIGGPGGEPTPGFTVTGHFAFGQAQVIADPFTGEPRFQLTYHQIYANNPNGIVAGSQDWSAYTGNLQRGWLGTRPVSDVLVKGDGQLLRELALQTEVLMARYRSGDGGGVALVTPATSCVQDSAQALWIAIDQLRRGKLEGAGEAQAISNGAAAGAAAGAATGAATAGGNAAVAEQQRLAALGRSLDRLLTPFGMVRSDWRRNAERVAGSLSHGAAGTAGSGDGFHSGQSPADVLLSWRSMLPRRAHDEFAQVFVRHGAPLWILRTNQVPGADRRLEPLAPTLVLGRIPVVSTLLRRLSDALFAPYPPSIPLTLALLGVYGALVLPHGLHSGFLVAHRRRTWPTGPAIARAAGLFLMPALVEELIFRIALLPHPLEGVSPPVAVAWGALSVGLFTLYHPLAGRLWYRSSRRLFDDPRFLVPCALLGVVCVIAYGATGSLWPPVLIHWLVVVLWLELLGGLEVLQGLRT